MIKLGSNEDFTWPTDKAQLADLINTHVNASVSQNLLLKRFAHTNLAAALATLPDNWTSTPDDSTS